MNTQKTIETIRQATDADLRRISAHLQRVPQAERAAMTDAEYHARATADAVDEVVDAALEAYDRRVRNDATAGIFLERLVRGGINQVFRHQFPARKWVNGGLVSLDMSISDGATSWDYQEIEAVGEAKTIGHDATDVPMADITGQSHVKPIHLYGIGYRYTRQEMRTAMMQGRFSISTERAVAAREGHDNKLNRVIFEGDTATGSLGLINTPGIIQRVSGTANWATSATAANIINEFGQAHEYMLEDSDGVEMPNTVVMPIDVYGRLKRLPMSQDNSETVLAYLQRNYPEIDRWEWAPEMATGDLARTGPSLLMYNRDPSRLRAIMPMRMRPTPPEARGLGWSVLFETLYGGMMIQRPRSILNLGGI